MKIRQGRRNKHNLYIMLGDEPSEHDISMGYIRFPQWAQTLVEAVNGGVVQRQSFVTDASWQRAEELRTERLGPGQDDIPEIKDEGRPSTSLRDGS